MHDIEAKEKGEVMAVEGHGKALKAVNLDEPRVQVHLKRVGSEQEQRWYLDFGASNHMTGSKAAFSELDDDVAGMVKFRAAETLELVHGDLCERIVRHNLLLPISP